MGKQNSQSQLTTALGSRDESESQTGWSAFSLFSQLIERYPWVFWSGLWLSLAIAASFAVVGLLNPSYVKQTAQKTSARSTWVSEDTAWDTRERTALPLWSLAAIAASCTAASILLSRQLNQPSISHKAVKTRFQEKPKPQEKTKPLSSPFITVAQIATQPTPTVDQPERPKPQAALAHSLATPSIAPLVSLKSPVASAQVAKPRRVTQPKKLDRSVALAQFAPLPAKPAIVRPPTPLPVAAPEPLVTVVPAEESHPLDWGEASLADIMDLRKQRSLSSLM